MLACEASPKIGRPENVTLSMKFVGVAAPKSLDNGQMNRTGQIVTLLMSTLVLFAVCENPRGGKERYPSWHFTTMNTDARSGHIAS